MTYIEDYDIENFKEHFTILNEIVKAYKESDELEDCFCGNATKIKRYAIIPDRVQESCLLYYYTDYKPKRLFKTYKSDYTSVWIDTQGKYLKSEYVTEYGEYITTYYIYENYRQIKLEYKHSNDYEYLYYVQICVYNQITLMIDTVTNYTFSYYSEKAFNHINEMLSEIYGVSFFYEGRKLICTDEYRFVHVPCDSYHRERNVLFREHYRHEHINGGIMTYYKNRNHNFVKTDFSKYHYYDKYFMGLL